MLLPPNSDELSKLHAGVFVLPNEVVKQRNSQLLLADDKRLRRSIKAMKTTLKRVGLSSVANVLPETHDGLLPQRHEALEADILRSMKSYLSQPHDAELVQVFHLVQLWGGIAGRNIYVMDGGFESNFRLESYRDFALAAISSLNLTEKVAELIDSCGKIRHFNVSFATKHACFWARATSAPPLPIYDNLMAAGCLGYRTATWQRYASYHQGMEETAHEHNMDLRSLERIAFAFFSSQKGRLWICSRFSR
jgi:hypothetical protein